MAGLSRLAAVLILAAALAACESLWGEDSETAAEPPSDPPADTTADTAAEAVPPSAKAGPSAVSVETEAAPSPGALAALAAEPVKVSEPSVDDDPQQLYGLDSGALGSLLGQPSLIRSESPAEIWQYRGRTCVFDVFLYDGADQPRVTYIEARDDLARRIDARGCLNELLRARMGLEPLG